MSGREDALLTVREVADRLKLSAYTIQKACQRGEFPGAFRTGDTRGPWRIPESAVAEYLKLRVRRTFPNGDYGVAPYRPGDRRLKVMR